MPRRRTITTSATGINKSQAAIRLDVVVARHAGISRERAQALILAGAVSVDGNVQRKAGSKIAPHARIELKQQQRYVGRGGFKLEKALREFGWSPDGLRCLDVGASTGGFTDCLLQHGAKAVVAVDVGYGHLAWTLRQDKRVTVAERCNFRYADLLALGAPFEFVCVDVSFISLSKLATKLRAALQPDAKLIALLKPQFEAGREAVQKGGVVRDEATQSRAIQRVIQDFLAAGLTVQKITHSPIKGPAGNIEFLAGAQATSQTERSPQPGRPAAPVPLDVAGAVRRAHEALD